MDIEISKAVVIGSGVMGHGVCQLLAQHGICVSLVDIDDTALDRAKGWITDNLAYMIQLGQLEDDRLEEILAKITFTTDLVSSLEGARYILEAASENFEIKRKIWAVLSTHAPSDAILASNTSSYDINELAEGISGPERIIGTHWFHPPPITPCVEVIPCRGADQANIEWVINLLTWLGKAPTVCKSAPGFVANRIQLAMAKEAITLVEEGLATPAEIDRIVKTSIGFRLGAFGPFEIIDQAGADVYYSVYEYLYSKLPREHFKPPKLLKDLVKTGRLGLKSSGGFYDYASDAADKMRRKRDRLLYTRFNQFIKEQESEK